MFEQPTKLFGISRVGDMMIKPGCLGALAVFRPPET
jgi:hypothetical protein